ncbi:MAG: hypothetical protein Q8Q33_03210 [Chlamydiota bacterium]|nr:hypothetical protein [Chlamydiota bacterium]
MDEDKLSPEYAIETWNSIKDIGSSELSESLDVPIGYVCVFFKSI